MNRKYKHCIIGGTGTLGRALIKRLSQFTDNHITCFSRDELKQKQLKAEYPEVECILGDIRDKDGVRALFSRGCDTAWLVAALKHVDTLEENPMEAVHTNVKGVLNVAQCAMMRHVPHVVFSSTDKAVLPINVYGMTKALAEKILLSYNRPGASTNFSIFRWGNVIGSRGSILHIIIDAIRRGESIPVTHPKMTRFLISIDDAVDFMLKHYASSKNGPKIPQMRAAPILDVIHAVQTIMGTNLPIKIIGIRPGEKIHECIESSHEYCLRSDNGEQFAMHDLISTIRPMVEDICASQR